MKDSKKSAERGVAVLFSLGILGMMTVLALTFASISMTNQTIAKNASQQSSAKEMARGIVERIQSALSYSGYTGGTPAPVITTPTQLQKFYSKESATSHFDWIWKLGMTGSDIESALYRTDEVCNYSSPGNLPTWQYVKDSSGKIVGRFAYVVRATDLPVIDLNTAFLKDDNTAASGSYTRLGRSLNEIDPNYVYAATQAQLAFASNAYSNFSGIDSDLLARARTTLASTGRTTAYADFETFLPAMSDNKKQVSKIIANAYTPRSVKYPEIFLTASGTAAYRFDLSQLTSLSGEANKRAMVEKMTGTGTGSNAGTLAAWGSDGKTTKIPWLADFTDTEGVDAKGYDNAAHKAKQIAANIVDFFSTDDTPTSDVDNNSWFTNTPKYIGLKKTPHLYGFGGMVQMVIKQEEKENPDKTKYYTQKATFSFTPIAYICNFIECPKDLKVGVNVTLTFKFTVGSENKEIPITYSNGEFLTLTGGDTHSVGYNVLDFEPRTNSLDYNVNKNSTVTMTSMVVSNLKVGLYYNSKWVDFSCIRPTSTTPSFGNSASINTSGTKTFSYPLVFRVSDPRHNLFEGQWAGVYNKENDGATVAGMFFQTGFADQSLNKSCADRTPLDHDFASDPPSSSHQTSYESTPRPPSAGTSAGTSAANNAHVYFPPSGSDIFPWQIGQIHRGHAWQTLNLKKYKTSNPTKGGSYSNGDAGLLDQVRMSSDVSTYGKIPLNEVWGKKQSNALFETLQRKAIKGGTAPSNLEGTNNSFRNTDFGLVNFFNTRKKTSPYYFTSRGELAKILTYSSTYHVLASNPTSDAAKEELFAKCAMLFDVEPTFLPRRVYVFGIAQTIQDIGGNGTDITLYKSWNGDGSITNNSETSDTGRYNAGYRTGVASGINIGGKPTLTGTINARLGRYDNGADKILSEQKVFAILEREYTHQPYSSSNRPVWKIVRFEYVQ